MQRGSRALRVLVAGHASEPSGAELALVRQLERLRRLGIDVQACFGSDGAAAAMARDAGARVHILELPRDLLERRRGDLRLFADTLRFAPAVMSGARLVAAIARAERIDVVSAYSMKAFAYASMGARLANVPLLWQLHDIPALPYFSASAQRAFRAMLRTARPRLVIVHSQAMVRALPSVPTAIVPHGVHRHAATPPRPAHGGVLRLGMAARLAEWKGQHVVIDALAQLPAETLAGVQLRMAGAPWFGEAAYAERLHRLVAERGLETTVQFAGHLSDVAAFYRDVDVAVHASTVPEPFGNAVVEALAAGLPVIASNAGGVAEILNGCDGAILVPAGDAAALARAISGLAAEDPAQLRRRSLAARVRARRYDARLEAILLARCFRAVAANEPPRLSRRRSPGLVTAAVA